MTEFKEDTFIRVADEIRQEMKLPIGGFVLIYGDKTLLLEVRKLLTIDKTDPKSLRVSALNYMKDTVALIPIRKPTIGSDVEFFLADDHGTVFRAEGIFPGFGEVGSDSGVNVEHKFSLAELRPRPALSAEDLVKNIAELVYRAQTTIRNLSANSVYKGAELKAFSFYKGEPAGFHIHIGKGYEFENVLEEKQIAKIKPLVYLLDALIAAPVAIIDSDNTRRRLRVLLNNKISYGSPSDVRVDSFTFEYRTLGGVVLRSPRLCKLVFDLTLLLVSLIFSGKTSEAICKRNYAYVSQIFSLLNTSKLEKFYRETVQDLSMPEITAKTEEILFLANSEDITNPCFASRWLKE